MKIKDMPVSEDLEERFWFEHTFPLWMIYVAHLSGTYDRTH